MFKIGTQRLTWVQVKWNGLDEQGHQVENEIELQMHLVDRDVFQEQLDGERKDGRQGEKFVLEHTHDWKGVGDESGARMPFSTENLQRLLQCPGVQTAIGQAYGRAWMGMGKTRQGNLEASPGAGGPVKEAGSQEQAG